MPYAADPGGQFSSDVHRRVLGHLTYPTDNYGWTVQALFGRMVPDVGTNLQNADEVALVLDELQQKGYAEPITVGHSEVWRMTQQGFDLLTGSIANEPPPGAEVAGPAMLGSLNAGSSATLIPSTNGTQE